MAIVRQTGARTVPPLSDSPIRYLPSHIAAATSRILAAYLAHHRVSAVEAARLTVRVESLLAELVSGAAATAAPPPVELEIAPRRARRKAPAKTQRSAAAAPAAAQAVFDLVEETEIEAEAEAPATPAEPAAPTAPVVEEPQEIDLLTGGPLPPATEHDDPVLPQRPVPAESPGTPGKKRKRPPRPASQRRAARLAAIEQMLVEGEEPPEGDADD
jgi:hypothetical protein